MYNVFIYIIWYDIFVSMWLMDDGILIIKGHLNIFVNAWTIIIIIIINVLRIWCRYYYNNVLFQITRINNLNSIGVHVFRNKTKHYK